MTPKLHLSKILVLLGLVVASLTACNRGGGGGAGTEQGGTSTSPPPAQTAPEVAPSTPSSRTLQLLQATMHLAL